MEDGAGIQEVIYHLLQVIADGNDQLLPTLLNNTWACISGSVASLPSIHPTATKTGTPDKQGGPSIPPVTYP